MTTRAGSIGGARGLLGRVQRVFARERGNFTWVYLWSAPIRAMHWIAAACVLTLIVTGFYIGTPVLRDGRRGERALPDGSRAVHPFRGRRGARDDGNRPGRTG